ncbi:hypothetical protein [Micromonospora sp. NPDC001898]|uniref:hypothetical protein n=1 Tax=Micromonospora sp. NPDC001898 TaxID=3364221 RepID=UPI0036B97977
MRYPDRRVRACGDECGGQPAKLGLRTEYARDWVALAIHLCVLMHDTVADRLRTHPNQVDPTGRFARFVGWTRSWSPRSPSPAVDADPIPRRPWTLPVPRSQQVSKIPHGFRRGPAGARRRARGGGRAEGRKGAERDAGKST